MRMASSYWRRVVHVVTWASNEASKATPTAKASKTAAADDVCNPIIESHSRWRRIWFRHISAAIEGVIFEKEDTI